MALRRSSGSARVNPRCALLSRVGGRWTILFWRRQAIEFQRRMKDFDLFGFSFPNELAFSRKAFVKFPAPEIIGACCFARSSILAEKTSLAHRDITHADPLQ